MRVIALDRVPEIKAGSSNIFERFLRERTGVWQQIAHQHQLDRLIKDMVLHAAGALASYGAVLGLSHSLFQALASAIKLPLLFLLTLAICLPALYLWNLLLDGRLTARQVCALVLSAMTVSAVFMLACVPITVFFLLTAHSYTFFVFLNVVILGITSVVGLRLLVEGVYYVNAQAANEQVLPEVVPSEQTSDEPPAQPTQVVRNKPANLRLLYTWLLLYAFVGTQLGWTLRPFFGVSDSPFQLFRAAEGNFYESVLTMLRGFLF